MSFTESLRKVMEDLKEAQGIALVGMDGIVIEEQKQDSSMDLQSLGAEWCAVIKQMDKSMSSMEFGSSIELCAQTEKGIILSRRIQEDYFLLLAIQADGNFGKGRYLLRREEINLKGEL